MESNTSTQTGTAVAPCPAPSIVRPPGPIPKIKVTHDYLDRIYPGCLYDAEREGEEQRATLKEKKRLRRQRYKANCKVRGKLARKVNNWSVAKEILNAADEQSVDSEDNLEEFAAFLDEVVASFPPSNLDHRNFEDEDWEKGASAKAEELQANLRREELDAQQQEAASVPLPDSDEEEYNREMAEMFADVPPECLPDIPANAPPSPPITAEDLHATLARAREVCNQGRTDRGLPEIPPPVAVPGFSSREGEAITGENQNNAFVLPSSAMSARSEPAPYDDVTSGRAMNDRNRRSNMRGLVSERSLDGSPSVLPRGRN